MKNLIKTIKIWPINKSAKSKQHCGNHYAIMIRAKLKLVKNCSSYSKTLEGNETCKPKHQNCTQIINEKKTIYNRKLKVVLQKCCPKISHMPLILYLTQITNKRRFFSYSVSKTMVLGYADQFSLLVSKVLPFRPRPRLSSVTCCCIEFFCKKNIEI